MTERARHLAVRRRIHPAVLRWWTVGMCVITAVAVCVLVVWMSRSA
jgi:fumarate reductase subunit D